LTIRFPDQGSHFPFLITWLWILTEVLELDQTLYRLRSQWWGILKLQIWLALAPPAGSKARLQMAALHMMMD
jgi:hypothetical protein